MGLVKPTQVGTVADQCFHAVQFAVFADHRIFVEDVSFFIYTTVYQGLFAVFVDGIVKTYGSATGLSKYFFDDIFTNHEIPSKIRMYVIEILHHLGRQLMIDGFTDFSIVLLNFNLNLVHNVSFEVRKC